MAKPIGEAIKISYALGPSRFGDMLVAATAKGICLLTFAPSPGDAVEQLSRAFPDAVLTPAPPGGLAETAADAALAFIEGRGPRPDVPLDLHGSAFQQQVWHALAGLKPGELVSYADIAARIGKPGAARAVGGANSKNPVPVIVPCHLVIAADGSIGGYTGGLHRKRHLLNIEAPDRHFD